MLLTLHFSYGFVAEHFGTFFDQVKRLLALSYGRFDAIRHKTCSRFIHETFSAGRKANALKLETL
jgi:hypothetical protein